MIILPIHRSWGGKMCVSLFNVFKLYVHTYIHMSARKHSHFRHSFGICIQECSDKEHSVLFIHTLHSFIGIY